MTDGQLINIPDRVQAICGENHELAVDPILYERYSSRIRNWGTLKVQNRW